MLSFLTKHWKNWKTDIRPIDTRMDIMIKNAVKGMSSQNIRFFINEFSKQYLTNTNNVYFEVGCYQGCSILSSAVFNHHNCVGIDNFSQFNDNGKNYELLSNNINKLKNYTHGKIQIINRDFRQFFKSANLNYKIGIYFYDGAHDYYSQLDGLTLAIPYLADKCIIFVDDVNLTSVYKANNEFVSQNPEFKRVLRIKTLGNCSSDWWNGWEVITRGYDFEPVEYSIR